jgi:hypothetical protein
MAYGFSKFWFNPAFCPASKVDYPGIIGLVDQNIPCPSTTSENTNLMKLVIVPRT